MQGTEEAARRRPAAGLCPALPGPQTCGFPRGRAPPPSVPPCNGPRVPTPSLFLGAVLCPSLSPGRAQYLGYQMRELDGD